MDRSTRPRWFRVRSRSSVVALLVLLCTSPGFGAELRGIGEVLAAGQIYDSNRYTLYGMLTRLGAELIKDRGREIRFARIPARVKQFAAHPLAWLRVASHERR